jgi:hypothetical protein
MHTLKIKSKTPNHLITQPNQLSSRHLPPPTARLRRADAAAHSLSSDFPAEKKKKKKKKNLATGGGRSPPLRPRERDPATPSGPFYLRRTQKEIRRTQKKFQPAYKIISNASKIDSNATKLVSNASKLKPMRKS